MTNTVATRQQAFSIEPISYPVIAEKIGELSREYMPLRVNGLNDTKGLKIVHECRMVVKVLRVSIEKRRKELKAASLEYGRQVDSAAKALTDLLEPIEDHLQAEEDAVEIEKARIKAAAEEAKRLKLQKRLDDILAYGVVFKPDWCAAMTDEAWAAELQNAKTQFEVRQAEQEAAAEKQKTESERLAAERTELDRQRKEQEAERARLAAEQKRLDDAAAEQRRAIELENAKREAAEKARVETEQRIAREQEHAKALALATEKRLKEEAEAKEAARLKAESERPQREKLLMVASLIDAIEIPDGPGSRAVGKAIGECIAEITRISNGPLA